MPDFASWQHGAALFPLTASTAKTLLEDADPGIFHTLNYLEAVLEEHIGARLAAQGAAVKLTFATAVRDKLDVEPSEFMGVEEAKFPLLSLYRKTEADTPQTLTYDATVSEWEYAYVLPPMQPHQVKALHAILRAVARTVGHAVNRGFDPAYKGGAKWWEEAGLTHARQATVRYGAYPAIDDDSGLYRCVVGTLRVVEREEYQRSSFEPFAGGNIAVDLKDADGTTLPDVAVGKTQQPPTFTSIVPNSGSKAGGTSVTVTGQRFKTPAKLRFDNVEVDAVVVSDTSVTAVTPPHAALPTFMSDVVVINGDGQIVRAPAAFTFTTP